ncbi:MAG TPA: 16S rRNA (guanine(966)-N(2))-methyltransferase RsmD [Tepidisphaeraceae bacterium]|nr:16S rRNA (guanine(966)-N(2))-methyltransferase RsmD [Tepidisphaeraceae bacterium]
MRIIAGEFRGRVLLGPVGDVTRPVTDRVKQSMFDILHPLLPGSRVYDCFAGTGSMGLESLSRGAVHATFFESDRSAGERLRRNVEALKAASRSAIVGGDLFRWFAAPRPPDTLRADVIFLDPPYRYLREKPDALRQWAALAVASHLTPGGWVVFRHDAADALNLPPLTLDDRRDYGGMIVEFLRAPALRDSASDAREDAAG